MRHTILLVAAALGLGAAPLAAQYSGGMGPPGGGGFGGAGGMGGGRHGGGGWSGHRGGDDAPAIPTDQELAGPPAPALLKGVLSLSDEQIDRYRPLWQQYMDETKPQRDSAQAALTGLQRARDDHDRTAMRQYFPVLHTLTPKLADRDKTFADKQLKPILTKDQSKSFGKWQDEQKKAADDARRQFGRS